MAVSGMRGLHVFISDIRNCQNKEQERARVDKELANIRTHFKTDRILTAYEKKKYVWKLLYIFMLGYEVEFGLVEATSLISASKYAEKQVGYVVTACLLNENHDFLRLVINTVRNDIISKNDTYQCLALTMVGNVGGKEFAEALALDVERLLMSTTIRHLVKKKAALCLLRLYRKSPDLIHPEAWSDKMLVLLEERDLGVLLCVVTLFITQLASNPEAYYACLPKLVRILDRLVRLIDIPQDYTYYAIPSPWLQVKVMRALQYFPAIEDPNMRRALTELLTQILQKTDPVKNVNKNNALHALLFEATALAMHMDVGETLLAQCVDMLGRFIIAKEPNIRYLALETLSRMLLVADVQSGVRAHQSQIVVSLRDPDISIRRRAMDLLYGMCDVENAKEIVEELLQYLSIAEYAVREELTLKIAVLAEKFAPNLKWYVDVILELTEKAGDFVSDDIWYRVVHFVTNNEDLQVYAAAEVVKYMKIPGTHETMVKIAGYILGEFGQLLYTAQPEPVTPSELFSLLHDKFPAASVPTKALLLSSYIKILMHAPPGDTDIQAKALAVFTKYSSFVDAEVQQRAVEYSVLAYKGQGMADIMAEMPKFPERESSLLKRAEDTEGDAPEASALKVRQQQALSQAIIPVPPRPKAEAAAEASPSANGVPDGTPGAIHVPPQSELGAAPRVDAQNVAVASPGSQPQAAPASGAPTPEAGRSPVLATSPAAAAAPAAWAGAAGGAAGPSPSSVQAQQVGDLLGELLLLEAPAPAAPAAAAPSPAGDAGSLALVLLDGSSAPAPAGPAPVVQPLGSIEEWFKALMTKDSGVLYEDPHLQIGVKAEWKGPHGRVTLYLGNKDTGPLSSLHAAVPPAAGLRLTLGAVPPAVPPRAQIQIAIDFAAVLAPKEVPKVELSYTTGSGLVVPLRLHLPAVISKFMQPATLAAADFFSRWKALTGPPLKLQEVVVGLQPLPLAAIAQLLTALHVHVVPNLDPNPNNLVACSSLFTETMPPVLLLTRIETDPADRTQMRLTVASPEPTATLSLKEYIKDNLQQGGLPWLRQHTRQPAGAGPGQAGAPALLQLPAPSPAPGTGHQPLANPQSLPQLMGVPGPAPPGVPVPQGYTPVHPQPVPAPGIGQYPAQYLGHPVPGQGYAPPSYVGYPPPPGAAAYGVAAAGPPGQGQQYLQTAPPGHPPPAGAPPPTGLL